MTERDETGRGRVLAVAALLMLSVVAPAFAGAAAGAPEDVSVTNYTVSETDVGVGETVNVTAVVNNTNLTAAESLTVNLTVNGSVVANETVEVDPDTETTVNLSTSFDAPGRYDVSVNGLGETVVTVTGEPNVSVVDYELDSTELLVDETLNATATVENTGTAAGNATVNLTVDGAVVANETVEVDADNDTNVTLSTSFDAPGTYNVTVDDLNATNVTVAAESEGAGNVSVSLEPSEELLRTGGVGQFDVVLNGTEGGVGSFDLTVTTENASHVEVTRAASNVSDNANVSIAVDENGTSVTVQVENGTTSDTGDVTLAVVQVRARAPTVSGPPSFVGGGPPGHAGPPGSDDGDTGDDYDFANVSGSGLVNLSVAVNDLADENGSAYAVNATGNASVVVEPGPPAEPPGLEKARDLDGDGTYDDLNGDGKKNVIDVATMLNKQNTIEKMPENARLGFDKNGDGTFDVLDVATFLEDV